jgi:hypothetical protein
MTRTDITDITDVAGEITAEQVTTLLAAGSLGFGVIGALAPATLRRAYGMGAADPDGGLTYLGRMWGSRTAVLGAMALAAKSPEDQRRLATLAAAMNAFDALAAAGTASLPTRTRVMGAMTSGFFAAAAAYGARLGCPHGVRGAPGETLSPLVGACG